VRHLFISFSLAVCVGGALADEKAITQIESGPLYLGSINSGFKVSEDYIDANLNLVAPVWSSLGSHDQLGGGILFLEPYVSWGENGEVATSLGLGYRYLFNDQPVSALRSPREDQAGFWDEGLAIGANFFVDLLDTEADNRFWQLGFGLEVATRYIELRGNYYLPLSDKQLAERRTFTERQTSTRTTTRPVTDTSAPYDNGQGLLVQDQTTSLVATTTTTTTLIRHIFERYEEGMEGWDAEVALLVPGIDKWCDVKLLGGYFQLDNAPFGPQVGGTGNVEGWKAGVEVRPVPAVALTAMWYEDERFLGSDWVFGARMEIPFEAGDLGDGKGMWGRIRDAFKPRRRHLVERLAEPVHRQNAAIHIANTEKQESKVAKQSTSSNTQVISQTKNKIVLGPAPSATEFTSVGYGSLTLSDPQYGGVVITSGVLMINRMGNTLFLPAAGTYDHAIYIQGNPVNPVTNGTTTVSFASTATLGGLTLSGTISGGTFNLTKTGAGTLVLGGTNTYSGGVTVSNGTLNVIPSQGGSLGSLTAGSTLNVGSYTYGGATLNLGGNTVAGGGLTFGGAVVSASSNTHLGSGALTLTGTSLINGGTRTLTVNNLTNAVTINTPVANDTQTVSLGTVLVGGNIPGGGTLVKSGAGTAILNGVSTYVGSTSVNAGRLVVSSWGALGSQSNLVINGVTGSGSIVLPQDSSASAPNTLYFQNSVRINGTAVSAGLYQINGNTLHLNSTDTVPLSGAIITAP
jgi:autotransporter-associated beta strand protein